MRSKPIFQLFVLIAVSFAAFGNGHPALARANAQEGTIVVSRDLTYWDATFVGFVDAQRFERWSFTLSAAQAFTVIATPNTPGLTPLLILRDTNGTELARAASTVNSTQPAGNYSLEVQPQAGSGFYYLSVWQVTQQDQPNPDQPQPQPDQPQPTPEQPQPQPDQPQQPAAASVATTVTPASVAPGESAAVTVSLANVPVEGFASTEFTCTYDAVVAEGSNIVTSGLFGADAAVALHGPQNGSFVVAIAGTNGSKAAAGGSAFTFSLKGLQAGQTAVECKARVSKGDGQLADIPSTPASLAVTAVSVQGSLTGQVHARKPVSVTLYNADNSTAGSATVNADGTFSVSAPAGTYTVVARAEGFLSAQGSTTLTAGGTSTLSAVNLLAGDIDGNNVIDQFDALTIGMSYNTAVPPAADLNNDGVVNVLDLELLAANYRKSGALAWQ